MLWCSRHNIKFFSDLWQVVFCRYSVSSTNKIDSHDITELLLKVASKLLPFPSLSLWSYLCCTWYITKICLINVSYHCIHYNWRWRVSFILWNITIWLHSYILLNTCHFTNGKIKKNYLFYRENTSKSITHLRPPCYFRINYWRTHQLNN
jgi:hypothetical protein